MTQALIVVPQQNELDQLVSGFERAGAGTRFCRIGRMDAYEVPKIGAEICVAGHGKAQCAAATSYLLCHRPQVAAVSCVGCAGALSPGLVAGDLVVSTATVEHDYRLRFVRRPPPEHAADAGLVDQFRSVVEANGYSFRVEFGRIASGDEDVVDNSRARELREETGALCVAWEGSGAARAAALQSRRFVEIRAITDAADQDAAGNFHSNLELAMPNLARVLIDSFSN